ncbi:MAG TPA: hypothetical protein VFG37_13690 [Planctomycetota bacterium]|jgi:hypothetical protein|nr:hypothetical protein [Planctomycetota bacterium]
MKPDTPGTRDERSSGLLQPKVRIVQVEPSRFMELLVSRRKLERVEKRSDQLVDVETHEIFVRIGKPEAHFAAGA